jgi:hypothetical protein
MLTTVVFAKLQVARKLTIATPSPELVAAYLAEIAKAYNVDWSPEPLDEAVGDLHGARVGSLAFGHSILLLTVPIVNSEFD